MASSRINYFEDDSSIQSFLPHTPAPMKFCQVSIYLCELHYIEDDPGGYNVTLA